MSCRHEIFQLCITMCLCRLYIYLWITSVLSRNKIVRDDLLLKSLNVHYLSYVSNRRVQQFRRPRSLAVIANREEKVVSRGSGAVGSLYFHLNAGQILRERKQIASAISTINFVLHILRPYKMSIP